MQEKKTRIFLIASNLMEEVEVKHPKTKILYFFPAQLELPLIFTSIISFVIIPSDSMTKELKQLQSKF